jgi:hypothetical protein
VNAELVEAERLRPADVLVTDEGNLFVHDVIRQRDEVRLLTNGAWWKVLTTTRFVRVKRDHRIKMGAHDRTGTP